MTSSPPPAFLFDIGNVILFFDFRIFARAVEPFCAVSQEDLLGLLRDPMHELEARSLPHDHFLDHAIRVAGYRGDRGFFVRSWQEIFEPNREIIDWIGALDEAGHRLCLLSNTNQMHVDHFVPAYREVFEKFDGHVFSHETGFAKPEREIYELTIDQLGLDPAATVYLDDKPENVAAGEAAGFWSILYERQPVAVLRRLAGLA